MSFLSITSPASVPSLSSINDQALLIANVAPDWKEQAAQSRAEFLRVVGVSPVPAKPNFLARFFAVLLS